MTHQVTQFHMVTPTTSLSSTPHVEASTLNPAAVDTIGVRGVPNVAPAQSLACPRTRPFCLNDAPSHRFRMLTQYTCFLERLILLCHTYILYLYAYLYLNRAYSTQRQSKLRVCVRGAPNGGTSTAACVPAHHSPCGAKFQSSSSNLRSTDPGPTA
jgi:hypothetical protein